MASRAVMAEEEAVRPAGARAESEVLGAASLPQGRYQTATTRAPAAASPDRGGGGWYLTGDRDFLNARVVADANAGF